MAHSQMANEVHLICDLFSLRVIETEEKVGEWVRDKKGKKVPVLMIWLLGR